MPDPSDDRTVAQPRSTRARGVGVSFSLAATEGPDAGRVFPVGAGDGLRVLLGKGPACEILLSDPEVSRRHCALEITGDQLRLTDLGSTNGTHVQGVCVFDALLFGGETLRVGQTVLQLQLAAATLPARSERTSFGRLLGASSAMRALYPLCERLAASQVPVVIEGETGTGKEVLAEALHEAGPRASGPYVVFDCSAVQATLAEAELFGHERGAFTGAVGTRKGVFELAHGGTLFIDEIGDLEPSLQPKLLRAVERGEVRRIGGSQFVKADVRVLAATRRDLDQEVTAGRFRDDLFHRLAVTRIELPPLRKRHGDVPLLVRHFWQEMGGDIAALAPDVVARWEAYDWPGNVRELRNTVARMLAVGDAAPNRTGGAPAAAGTDALEEVLASKLPLPVARQKLVQEFERRYVERVLAEHGGDTARAAQASGIARRYFNLIRSRRR
ncbi:MAG TPA: sigma 54-interacting transcriptional regulator [Polyangiaceae bacterium]|jgi:DNA-binding NtrC family response regulator